MPFLSRLSLRFLGTLLIVVAAVYFVRATDARRMPDLAPEHRIHFDEEFSADQEGSVNWQAYLAIEDAVARELEDKIRKDRRSNGLLDRYAPESLTFPDRFDGNWNRSYVLSAAAPRGVAVLLHGLSDSPYSMLATAEDLVGAGYNVVVPRLPGHGFAVGGLRQARWRDWTAVARIAARHARRLPGGDLSFIVGGYSNGGLLAIDYALNCNDQEVPCPDRLILESPAIAVTPLARVANWHAAISWIPYFEKFGWLSILPEIDPFKFTSFPKRAGWETYNIGRRVQRLLGDPARVDGLPPILTFQSVVDDTVSSTAVVANLYSKLPANGSELIVYDINRNNTAVNLMQKRPEDPLVYFKDAAPLNYGVTVLRNRNTQVLEVDAATLPPGSSVIQVSATGLSWPQNVYSLSHIALPFRADDALYGDGKNLDLKVPRVVFGAMAPRGERGVLMLSPEYFLRARHNPFYPYQAKSLARWLPAQ